MQLTGLLLTTAGLLSLNRSYAIVPANRGIKTGGMYRLVRHPLYLGYLISDTGLLINQFSLWNLYVVGTAALLFIARIHYEEKFLLQDAAYRDYCDATRYRLIPGIW